MQKIWRKIKPVEVSAAKRPAVDTASVGGRRTAVKETAAEKTGGGKGRKSSGTTDGGRRKVRKQKTGVQGRRKLQVTEIHRQSLKKKLDLLSFREVFDAHEVFSSILPSYIEKYILRHRKKGSGKDPYILKGALHIIQNFIKSNYDSLTYDWSSSIEKQEVSNIGFTVPEIDTIIAMCLEEVRMRRMTV